MGNCDFPITVYQPLMPDRRQQYGMGEAVRQQGQPGMAMGTVDQQPVPDTQASDVFDIGAIIDVFKSITSVHSQKEEAVR